MYRNPYLNYYNESLKTVNKIKEIDSEIDSERKKESPNAHRIAKLREQRAVAGLFDFEFGNYSRYRSRW